MKQDLTVLKRHLADYLNEQIEAKQKTEEWARGKRQEIEEQVSEIKRNPESNLHINIGIKDRKEAEKDRYEYLARHWETYRRAQERAIDEIFRLRSYLKLTK